MVAVGQLDPSVQCRGCRSLLVTRLDRWVCPQVECGIIYPFRFWTERAQRIKAEQAASTVQHPSTR